MAAGCRAARRSPRQWRYTPAVQDRPLTLSPLALCPRSAKAPRTARVATVASSGGYRANQAIKGGAPNTGLSKTMEKKTWVDSSVRWRTPTVMRGGRRVLAPVCARGQRDGAPIFWRTRRKRDKKTSGGI